MHPNLRARTIAEGKRPKDLRLAAADWFSLLSPLDVSMLPLSRKNNHGQRDVERPVDYSPHPGYELSLLEGVPVTP